MMETADVLYVNITEDTECNHSLYSTSVDTPYHDDPQYIWFYIIQFLAVVSWIGSLCYHSDHSIIRRITKKRRDLYNRIRPVIYSRK